MENAKLKRKSFTVEQKVEIIRLIQQESQISAAVKFNLTPTTVNTIYKHREKILDEWNRGFTTGGHSHVLGGCAWDSTSESVASECVWHDCASDTHR